MFQSTHVINIYIKVFFVFIIIIVIVFYFNNEVHEKVCDGRYVKHDRRAMITLVVTLYYVLEK